MKTMDWVWGIITTASLLIGIYGVRKSRRSKRLSYATRSVEMVKEKVATFPRLSVSYDGQPVERLSATKMLILNTGQSVIRQEDIAPSDPLRAVVDEPGTILRAFLGRQIGKANRVRVSASDLQFDYLAPGEGCLLSVLHTAKGSPRFGGTLIGGAIRQQTVLLSYSRVGTFMLLAMACLSGGAVLLKKLDKDALTRMWPFVALLGLGAAGFWLASKLWEKSLKRKEAGYWESETTEDDAEKTV